MDLSIIIPVFNEEEKIANDVRLASKFLFSTDLQGEIIIVDDGSTDKTSETLTRLQIRSSLKFRILRHCKNQGKGSAIRTGIVSSLGDYVMFVDSGFCVPYNCALDGIKLLASDKCDFAFGSRKLPNSIITNPQNIYRRITSKLFNIFVTAFLEVPAIFTDTQCGFKIFKGDVARRLFSECKINGFTFDIEVILRALKKGYRISEFPIKWSSDVDSRVQPLRMSFKIFGELLKTKRILLTLESSS